jgi:DnaJ-class molecular chaperone
VEAPCAFCNGTGRDPFGIMSWLSTCCVCKGKSIVQVQAPYARCAHCHGTGAIKTLTCTACGGKGLVPLPVGPTVVCSECQGTGDDGSVPAMTCLRCRGRGWVPG